MGCIMNSNFVDLLYILFPHTRESMQGSIISLQVINNPR